MCPTGSGYCIETRSVSHENIPYCVSTTDPHGFPARKSEANGFSAARKCTTWERVVNQNSFWILIVMCILLFVLVLLIKLFLIKKRLAHCNNTRTLTFYVETNESMLDF